MVTAGIEEVQAVDDTTVKVVCAEPKADMVSAAVPILPEHIWRKVDPRAAEQSFANKPPIVGSGPFQVTELKKGAYVKLERNPYYWGKKSAVDEILFATYTNADTMVQDLKLGMIDAAQGIPRAQYEALRDDSDLTTVAYNLVQMDYLTFNCYEGSSKGSPALRDREVRRALVFAMDQSALVSLAYGGLAEPGTTWLSPHTWSNPDWHWEPPVAGRFAFDLDRARQMLATAGYLDRDGDGVREDESGKPFKVRLWAAAESVTEQTVGKMIAGWWKSVGVAVEFQVLDTGAIDDGFWNYEGSTYVPDYDAYLGPSTGFLDPGQTLEWWTTPQIGNWNVGCWSNDEYDQLYAQQSRTVDPERRREIVWRMQEILYEEAVTPVLTYPKLLQAYNTAKWTGWTALDLGGAPGPVLFATYTTPTYLNLEPVERPGPSGSHSWVGVAVIILLVGGIALVLLWRVGRRASKTEEQ